MSNEAVTKAVTQFYDSHPINEDQILHALRQSGIDLRTTSVHSIRITTVGLRRTPCSRVKRELLVQIMC